jgi:hypothetical protein
MVPMADAINDESPSSPHATASPSMMQERKRSLRNDMGRYIEGDTDTSRVSTLN